MLHVTPLKAKGQGVPKVQAARHAPHHRHAIVDTHGLQAEAPVISPVETREDRKRRRRRGRDEQAPSLSAHRHDGRGVRLLPGGAR